MDVLISGMGIAGPTLAWWLRRRGMRPTLVEIAPEPREGGYIIDFWGKGYDIADAMGLLPAIRRVGYHVREVRLVGAGGEKRGGFSADVFARVTNGRYISLPRGDLARVLHDAIADDVETRFGDHVAAIERRGGKAEVSFASGDTRAFDLVVGAGGVHSGVRAVAFGSEERFERFLGYGVAAFVLPGYAPRDEDVYVLYSEPGIQVGRFAQRDGSTLVLLVFAEQEPLAVPHGLDARKALLRRRFEDVGWETPAMLDAMGACGEVYLDRVSQIELPEWASGPVVLVGDAAYAPSLLAGQGSALAMIGAYVLAGELGRAGGDVAEACARYEALLGPFMRAKQKAARRFAASFAPPSRLGIRVREWVTRAMDLPFVAELAIGGSIRDQIELPAY